MDITPLIRELIILNECIILRGVGGFETTYRNATFQNNKSVIIPPGKSLKFRPELIHDNGVLEKHIMRSTGISREEASVAIDKFVQDFFVELKNTGRVLMDGIGNFTMDEHGKLNFQELDDVNYLADSYGLDNLEFIAKPIENQVITEATPIPLTPQKRKLTPWYVAIGVMLLVIAITILILISQSTGKEILFFGSSNSPDESNEIVVFGPTSSAVHDSITEVIEKTINDKTSPKNALALENGKPESLEKEKIVRHKVTAEVYLLIAGSFKNSKNAEQMKDQLVQEGFAPEVLYTGGNYYRVVIGKFNDRQAAIDELRRIRKQIDQSVWLWERTQ